MNIKDFGNQVEDWVQAQLDKGLDVTRLDSRQHVWGQLLGLRQSTFTQLAALETEQSSTIRPLVDFSTKVGQEAVRVLCTRILEEMLESHSAFPDIDHAREELIDVLNYTYALLIMKTKPADLLKLFAQLSSLFSQLEIEWADPDITPEELKAHVDMMLTSYCFDSLSAFFPTLRNRTWQVQTQSPHFDGSPELLQLVLNVTTRVLSAFPDWLSFVKMFVAKDIVLQFRLTTKY